MKFEFVEFYPLTEKNRKNASDKFLGTVHLYLCDIEMDLRGIKVVRSGKGLIFIPPHHQGLDGETGEPMSYPYFRFTNANFHKEFLDFLHKEVKPIVSKLVNGPKSKRDRPRTRDNGKDNSSDGKEKIVQQKSNV